MSTDTAWVEAIVGDPYAKESMRKEAYPRGYRNARPSVAEGEEDEDHQRHDDGDERHHRQHARAALVAHSADALRPAASPTRSATR